MMSKGVSAVVRTVGSRYLSTGNNVVRFTQAQMPLVAAAGKRRSTGWWLAVGFGSGAVIGVVAGFDQIKKMRTPPVPVANSGEQGPIVLEQFPDVKISRSVRYPMDTSGLKLTLFQYQTCPFCCKVRALLDFLGVSYDVVEVNSITRTQMKWSKSYKKVPILVVQTPQGEVLQLNDSSMIVSVLYSYLLNGRGSGTVSDDDKQNNSLFRIAKFYPTVNYNDDHGKVQADILNKYFLMMEGDMPGKTKTEIVEERKWRKWADDVYVHLLSPNIYRTYSEALESFQYFDKVGEWDKNFTDWERKVIIYLGASAMLIIGNRLKKKHNLRNDVRQSLYDESDYWLANIKKKGGRFMGGDTPNLSDLAVYGVLTSIEGCQAFKDLVSHSQPMEKWYLGVRAHLSSSNLS